MEQRSAYEAWLDDVGSRTAAAVTYPKEFGGRRLASRWDRFVAAFFDFLLDLAAAMPGLLCMLIGVGLLFGGGYENLGFGLILAGYLVVIPIGLGVLGIYQMVLLSRDGQTIGKRKKGLVIVKYQDGSQVGFVRGWLLRRFVPQLIYGLSGSGLFIADVLVIFGEERRCLHDYLAGTTVVQS